MNLNLIEFAEELQQYLIISGVEFSENGYPIFKEEMLLKEQPKYILPIDHMYATCDKSKTLLVSFCNDEIIYKKWKTIKEDIPKYKEYLGVAGFDLSPRINWDINLQRFNILLNMLVNAYLVVNGIKIMLNFRTGCLDTMDILNNYPKHAWYIVGTLGCSKGHVKVNEMYLRIKIMLTQPDMLIYYGILKQEYKNILNYYSIPYKVFPDFQRISRGKVVI